MKLDDLRQKYPKAFISYDGHRYGFPLFGWECGDGWYSLIEPLVKYVHEWNSDLPPGIDPIHINQVKEKFAGLRFYVSNEPEGLENLISIAEKESFKTCEVCGKPGSMRGKRWFYTACDEHTKDSDK